MNAISKKDLIWMYRKMKTSRYFEERMEKAYLDGKQPVFNIGAGSVPGEMHLSSGQEPAAVGIIVHLTENDTVTATHRPHHQAIAKGVNLKKMAAEIFGKESGLGKGKGGHMHLFDPEVKFSCGGIVGAGIPHAVGAALANKKKGTVVFKGGLVWIKSDYSNLVSFKDYPDEVGEVLLSGEGIGYIFEACLGVNRYFKNFFAGLTAGYRLSQADQVFGKMKFPGEGSYSGDIPIEHDLSGWVVSSKVGYRFGK